MVGAAVLPGSATKTQAGTAVLVTHWIAYALSEPVPMDSRQQVPPLVLACTMQCVDDWRETRKLARRDVALRATSQRLPWWCAHCISCGSLVHPAGVACLQHQGKACPEVLWEATAAAGEFGATCFQRLHRQTVTDDLWAVAAEHWEDGERDGHTLSHLALGS